MLNTKLRGGNMGLRKSDFKGMSVDEFTDLFFSDIEFEDTKNTELGYKNTEIPKPTKKKVTKHKEPVAKEPMVEESVVKKSKVKEVNPKKLKAYELFDKGLLNKHILAMGDLDGIAFTKSSLDSYRKAWLKENDGNEKYIKYKASVGRKGSKDKPVIPKKEVNKGKETKGTKTNKKTTKSVKERGTLTLKKGSLEYTVDKKGVKLELNKPIVLDSEDLAIIIDKLEYFNRGLKS